METTLLEDWLVRAKRKANAHACCASRCEMLRKVFGVPAVALSGVTGTAVVAQQIARDPNEWTAPVVALVLMAAIVSSVQTFLDYGARAERHKASSAGFSSLRRQIQCLIETKQAGDQSEIDHIRKAFDDLIATEPIIPNAIWKTIEKKYPRA